MNYQPVPLDKAYLLLNHGPTIMISSALEDKQNIMSAAWSTTLDFDPPKLVVIIDKNNYSKELIQASGEFAVIIPSKAQAKQVLQVGTSTGREIDKFKTFGLTTLPSQTIKAPLIQGSLAALECKLIPEPYNQDKYDLYIGEVTAAWADPEVFSHGRWHITSDQKRSIHYQAGGTFFQIGDQFTVE